MKGFRNSFIADVIIDARGFANKKAFVESWIEKTIAGDAAIGRTGSMFSVDPMKAIKQDRVDALRNQGIFLYAGSGNYFEVDMARNVPRVMQRRPLGQRVVELYPEGGNA